MITFPSAVRTQMVILGLVVLPMATPVLLSLVYQNLGNIYLMQWLTGREGSPRLLLERAQGWEEMALQVWDGNQRARWSLGYAHLALGNKESAIKEWRSITHLALRQLLRLSDLAYQASDYQRALELGNLAIELEPLSSSSFFRLGRAYQGTGDWQMALWSFQKAMNLANFVEGDWLDLASAYFARGEIYAAQGHWGSAVAEFEAGLVFREEAEIYRSLGKIYHQGLGDLTSAEHWLKKALALDPGDYWSMVYLGRLYIDAGRYEEAVLQLQFALSLGLDPESYSADLASGHEALARAYSLQSRWAEAIPHWRMAASLSPTNRNAWVGLGDAYLALGELERAREAYTVAAQLDPQNSWLRERIESLR